MDEKFEIALNHYNNSSEIAGSMEEKV